MRTPRDPRPAGGPASAGYLPIADYGIIGNLTDDGLPGGEGAFGLCTCWLVDVLALSGRVEEAKKIFTGLVARTNRVGLLPEEFGPDAGEYLGNFPQAYTHIGLVNSVLYLAHAEGRWVPEHAPAGISREGLR
jgi:GH15 family glucan-1,4-alpha-glucosidase